MLSTLRPHLPCWNTSSLSCLMIISWRWMRRAPVLTSTLVAENRTSLLSEDPWAEHQLFCSKHVPAWMICLKTIRAATESDCLTVSDDGCPIKGVTQSPSYCKPISPKYLIIIVKLSQLPPDFRRFMLLQLQCCCHPNQQDMGRGVAVLLLCWYGDKPRHTQVWMFPHIYQLNQQRGQSYSTCWAKHHMVQESAQQMLADLYEKGLKAAMKTAMNMRCFTTHPLSLFAASWWYPYSLHRRVCLVLSCPLVHQAAGSAQKHWAL